MLIFLLTTIALSVLAVYAVAKATQAVMGRLGLDPMAVMLWLGLAERPAGPRLPRAREAARLTVDKPARRRARSQHRQLVGSALRRRKGAPSQAPLS